MRASHRRAEHGGSRGAGGKPAQSGVVAEVGFGIAAEPLSSLSVTADYYYIEVDDGIER